MCLFMFCTNILLNHIGYFCGACYVAVKFNWDLTSSFQVICNNTYLLDYFLSIHYKKNN